jgi:hypothetical protein
MIFLFQLLIKFLKLDISFFIEEYIDENLDLISSDESNLPKKGYLVRLASFLSKMLFNSNFFDTTSKYRDCDYILACNSENEFLSTNFLFSDKKKPLLLGEFPRKHSFMSFLIGFILVPIIFYKVLNSENLNVRKSLHFTLDQLMIASGLFFTYSFILKDKNFKSIIISNHMHPASRVILFLAKTNNIKTVYIEHTLLIENWPSIDCDFFLLCGNRSLEKLKKINENLEYDYLLVGSPKLDFFEVKSEIKRLKEISICLSPGFNNKILSNLVHDLKSHFSHSKISIRPHPAIRISYLKPLEELEESGVSIIHPKKESIESFFSRNDLIISADSGIFFEAGYLGIYSLKYKMSESQRDVYNAKDSGINVFENTQNLISEINKLLKDSKAQRNSFGYFYDTLNSKFEGKSGKLALNFLRKKNLI